MDRQYQHAQIVAQDLAEILVSGDGFGGEVMSTWHASEMLLNKLKGWEGIKGQGDANKNRVEAAQGIASVLKDFTRSIGHDVDPVEVHTTSVSGGFRSGYRPDYADNDSYNEQSEKITGIANDARIKLEKRLEPWKKAIQSIGISHGEKGWFSVDIELH